MFLQLIFPKFEAKFSRDRASLCKPKKVDSIGGPAALFNEVVNDFRQEIDSWCRIGILD